jgi:DNA-binding transcriptional MocR family regulator
MGQYSITGSSAAEIVRSVEDGVRAGALASGDRLPTVRVLADELSLSRTTVAAAYQVLRQRGLLNTNGRRGTVVAHRPPVARRHVGAPIPDGVRNLGDGNPAPDLLPDLNPLLDKLRVDAPVLYGQEAHDPELFEQARAALEADGISAEHLAVASGGLDAMERVLVSQLSPGARVAVEDPGYPSVLDLVAALGLTAVPVLIDESGPRPDALRQALASGVAAVILTPRAQNPTGAALDLERRGELEEILKGFPDALLIQDDHAPLVAGVDLCPLGTDRRRWAHIRGVAKSLAPDLRVAVLAGDEVTVGRVEGRQALGTGWVSHILQRLTALAWADPAVRGGQEQAARVYTERRQALVHALDERGIAAWGRSGFNVWVPVREELQVVQRMSAMGYGVAGGEPFRSRSGLAVRVTVSTLDAAEASDVADALEQAMSPSRLTRSV